jgi:hypothetical protein
MQNHGMTDGGKTGNRQMDTRHLRRLSSQLLHDISFEEIYINSVLQPMYTRSIVLQPVYTRSIEIEKDLKWN